MSAGGTPAANMGFTYDWGFSGGSANREDLLDVITTIDPWDTPFYSSAPKVNAMHTTHEWLVDAYAATATGGALEGGAFSADASLGRTRLTNWTQIFRREVSVADTQRAVNPAGIRDEYEYQVMKRTREIARNIESRIFTIGATTATGGSGTIRIMKTLSDFGLFSATFSAALGSANFSAILNLHEQIYTAGGNPDALYLSPGVKADFTQTMFASGSATARQITLTQNERRIIQNIDVFESDFGLLAIIPDRFVPQFSATAQGNGGIFMLERSKAKIATLRPVKHTPMGKVGDDTRGMVVGELTLQVDHPSAHGYVRYVIT